MEWKFTYPRCPSPSDATTSVAEIEQIYSLFNKRYKFWFNEIDCLGTILRTFSLAMYRTWQLLGSEHEVATQRPLREGIDLA